ncbi:MAG: hypothetical protein Q4B43_00980 [Bacteroidota bacterium]|nr:hypothetical protein [Bacteroidota bacterium]
MNKIIITVFSILGALTVQAQCNKQTNINENFDKWKDIDQCWDVYSGEAMLFAKEGKVVFYSMTSPNEEMYLVTPKLSKGTYTVSLDGVDKNTKATLVLYAITDFSDVKTYTPLTKAVDVNGQTIKNTITINQDLRIGIRVNLPNVHQAVYIDNVVITKK